jgi:hypothetical protein
VAKATSALKGGFFAKPVAPTVVDSNGATLMHIAALAGNVPMCEALFECGVPVDVLDGEGCTALFRASGFASGAPVVAWLLGKPNCRAAQPNKAGSTALHWASMMGVTPAVKELLVRSGTPAFVNMGDIQGKTALHWAATYDRGDIVVLLLKRGANVEARDRGMNTPLLAAVKEGKPDMVRLLLEAGASVEVKDVSGKVPLDCACDDATAAMLLELVGVDLAAGAVTPPWYAAILPCCCKVYEQVRQLTTGAIAQRRADLGIDEDNADLQAIVDRELGTRRRPAPRAPPLGAGARGRGAASFDSGDLGASIDAAAAQYDGDV